MYKNMIMAYYSDEKGKIRKGVLIAQNFNGLDMVHHVTKFQVFDLKTMSRHQLEWPS